jgi:hypothetical protein
MIKFNRQILRNILIGSSMILLSLLVTLNFFFKKPVRKKEIPNTVYVFNETKYDVEFKTKLIINKIFELDSIYIKYGYMIEPLYINGIEISAHVVKNPMFEKQYMVFMSKKLKPYHEDIVISHELQHINQFESNDLEILDVFMGIYRYKQDTLEFTLTNYSERPEEKEAYAMEDSIYNQLQILIKEYEK